MLDSNLLPITTSCDFTRPVPRALAGNLADRLAAAKRSDAPGALEALSRDRADRVRIAVVRNPACPSSVRARLLRDPEPKVRAVAAAADWLASEQVGPLLFDPEANVRRMAVRHPAAAHGYLTRLASTERDLDVLRSLAVRPDIRPETLHAMAQNPCLEARCLALRHPATPMVTILPQAKHAASRARRLRSMPGSSPRSRHEAIALCRAVAGRSDLPLSLIRVLASVPDPELERSLARYPSLPADVIAKLDDGAPADVRASLRYQGCYAAARQRRAIHGALRVAGPLLAVFALVIVQLLVAL